MSVRRTAGPSPISNGFGESNSSSHSSIKPSDSWEMMLLDPSTNFHALGLAVVHGAI